MNDLVAECHDLGQIRDTGCYRSVALRQLIERFANDLKFVRSTAP